MAGIADWGAAVTNFYHAANANKRNATIVIEPAVSKLCIDFV